MDRLQAVQWPLASGNWTVLDETGGIHLAQSALENAVAPALSADDIAKVMAMRAVAGTQQRFPPEFQFSPLDGQPLEPVRLNEQRWVPPYGAPAANQAGTVESGLKRTRLSIDPQRLRSFAADSVAQFEMPLPPPGKYEFFSSTFGTVEPVMLALDVSNGAFFAWLPDSASWQAMSNAFPLLSDSDLPTHAWRAEMRVAFNSRLFIPTEHGLANVRPDYTSLQVQVDYIGNAPVVGGPLVFDKKIYAPIQHEDGAIQFVFVDAEGNAGAPMRVEGRHELGAIGVPAAYGRVAIWPCEKGQLRLQQQRDGSVTASFVAWPAGITPHFEFGCVHMSNQGHLWQLCFDARLDSYVYVRLDVLEHEQVQAQNPRTCSGTLNYRFATKFKTDPWIEPEHGDDGAVSTVVVPLLQVGERAAVLSLHIDSSASLTSVLNSTERVRARLAYDDESNDIIFHTIAVASPWDMRLFLHDGRLWAYHTQLRHILGWDVQA